MLQQTTQPQDLSLIEKALEARTERFIAASSPITLSYFDLQRLIYLERQATATRIQVHLPYRLDSEAQGLYQRVQKSWTAGARVTSVSVHTSFQYTEDNTNTNARVILDLIDLVMYLSSDNAAAVQAFNDQSATNTTTPRFSLVAGSLVSGGSFSLHIATQETVKPVTVVQAILSTGEALNASIPVPTGEANSEGNCGTLEDSARALRVYLCAVRSLETTRRITIKHITDSIIPVKAVGTAEFLREGLFVPTFLNGKLAVTGLYSARTDKVRELTNDRVQEGEPFEYFPSHEALMNNPYTNKAWTPIVYVPSLVGTRKNKEMVDALKSGYLVLAEKPAFPNANIAKDFLANLDKEHQKRLFFGWHYQRHYVFRRLLEDINKNTFGKIKHIKTVFVVPKLLDNGRLFEPAVGGAGVDIHCYNLHYTLRLVGFNHGFEVVESKIENAQYLDPTRPELSKIDFTMNSKIKFSNGTTAEAYSSFNNDTMIHSEGEILFEDGTRIMCKEFVHSHMITRERFEPIIIFRAGGTRWENYLTEADSKNPEYWKTTYERQIEFIRRQATGEENYDVVNNDVDGLGLDANIKLHELIDAIFVAGGYEKKKGA